MITDYKEKPNCWVLING